MKASVPFRFFPLPLLTVLISACTLIPTTPSVTLTVSKAPYSGSTISIPYSYATLSSSSGNGEAECLYTLSKWTPADGSYRYLTSKQGFLASSGSLSFDLSTLLGATAATGAQDGSYEIKFEVLTGNHDSQGNPVPVPFLSSTQYFTVHAVTGAEVLKVTPAFLSAFTPSQPITAEGVGFTSSSVLTVTSSSGSSLSASTFSSPTKMTAKISPSTSSSITSLTIAVSGSSAPAYQIPVLAPVVLSSVLPLSGSRSNSHLPVYLTGTALGKYTSVSLSSSSGASTSLSNPQLDGTGTTTYLFGYLDLTSFSVGSATLTAKNPDGSTSSISFKVTN